MFPQKEGKSCRTCAKGKIFFADGRGETGPIRARARIPSEYREGGWHAANADGAGAPGLTYLNGRLCGETGAVALPLARDGIQYLEVRPFGLETAGTALRLRLRGGCLCDGLPSGACAVQWPNGHIAIELRHEPPDRPETDGAPPALLDAWEGPDGRYLLVSEAGAASFGRSAAEAVFLPVPAPGQASLRPLAQRGWLAAEGACGAGRFAAVLQAQGEPALLACASGLSASVDGQGALHCMEAENDLVGHARAGSGVRTRRGDTRRARKKSSGSTAVPAGLRRPGRRRGHGWKPSAWARRKKRPAIWRIRSGRKTWLHG